MFIIYFKKFISYVLFISILSSFQSSPLQSMQPPHWPPTTVEVINSCAYALAGCCLGNCTYSILAKCEKSCKKRSRARRLLLDPEPQDIHHRPDNGINGRVIMNDETDQVQRRIPTLRPLEED